jgi:hypothetical protein
VRVLELKGIYRLRIIRELMDGVCMGGRWKASSRVRVDECCPRDIHRASSSRKGISFSESASK